MTSLGAWLGDIVEVRDQYERRGSVIRQLRQFIERPRRSAFRS